MKKEITLWFLLLMFLVSEVSGQKSIQEWAASDQKKFSKGAQYLNTLNHMKTSISRGWLTPEQVPELKNVGILTLLLIQPSYMEKSGTSIYTNWLTDSGGEFVMDVLFPVFGKGMKVGFENSQVKLIGENEYLNSEEKKAIYNSTEFKPSKLMGATASIASRIQSPKGPDDPRGCWGKMIVMSNADIKTWREVAAFAKKMELDGLLIVEQTVYFDGKSMALGPIMLNIIGPNPTPETEKTSYAPVGPLKGYLEGFIYGAVTLTPPDPYLLAKVEKKKLVWQDINGLEIVYKRQSEDLISYIRDELDKVKK